MKTVFFIPPLSRMSGGLATIYAMAGALHAAGVPVALTCPASSAPGLDHAQEGGLSLLPWPNLPLKKNDVWVVPESWPNALVQGVQARCRVIIYAQSWNFLLTTLPGGVHWKQLPVDFLAVSRPVQWFLQKNLSVPVKAVLPPSLAPDFTCEIRPDRGDKPIRIAFMPRKNNALAQQAKLVSAAVLADEAPHIPIEWLPIAGMSLPEVAATLSKAHLFFATAFPEGFGLPPLEAMACGCVPVGFTGFGGWEYMRQIPDAADILGQDAAWHLACPPPFLDTPAITVQNFSGNGFFVSDGDIIGAGRILARAVQLCNAGAATAAAYKHSVVAGRIIDFWKSLERNHPF